MEPLKKLGDRVGPQIGKMQYNIFEHRHLSYQLWFSFCLFIAMEPKAIVSPI